MIKKITNEFGNKHYTIRNKQSKYLVMEADELLDLCEEVLGMDLAEHKRSRSVRQAIIRSMT